MPEYFYKAKDESGKSFSGVLEADNKKELRKKLRSSGYYVVSIAVKKTKNSGLFKKKVSLDVLIMFTHQLTSLLEAGLPILMALDILWRQITHPRMQVVISQIKNKLNSGGSISEAVDDFPDVFPLMYRKLLTVAETGGGLVPILNKILEYLANQKEFQSKIKKATTYPVVVVCFSVVVVILMLLFVVPTFQKVFDKLHMELPLPTKLVMMASDFLKQPLFWIIVFISGVAVFFLYKKLKTTAKGRLKIDKMKMKLPVFGSIFYLSAVSRFIRSLGLLLSGGLPAAKSIEVAKATSINQVMENGLEWVEKRIVEGASLSEALRETEVFPVLMVEMVSVGEQSGTLSDMLEKSANYFEEELEEKISRFLSMLEPLLIIFVGGVVMFIMLSIYLPIFSMWQGLT